MKRESISVRNAGKLDFTFENRKSKGFRVARDFIQDFVYEFAKTSSYYLGANNVLKYPPFGYKERQLSSILGIVFHEITNFHFPELPIKRTWPQSSKIKIVDDSHGWTDFFCTYKGFVFLIEFKHSHISIMKRKPSKYTISELWPSLHEQINSSKSEALFYRSEISCKGIFRLGIHIMPIYRSSSITDLKFDQSNEAISEIKSNIYEKLNPKPDFYSQWSIKEKLRGPFKYDSKNNCYYPAVLFVGVISKPLINN